LDWLTVPRTSTCKISHTFYMYLGATSFSPRSYASIFFFLSFPCFYCRHGWRDGLSR
jgi:hypothetical protein